MPSTRPSLSRIRGVAPRSEIRSASAVTSVGREPAFFSIASIAPFRIVVPAVVLTPLVRVSARNGDLLDDRRAERREARVVADAGRPTELGQTLAGQVDDRATLRGLVADRGDEGRLDRVRLGHARRRGDRGGKPVAVGDGARLVEQDDVDVAGRLDGAAAHGQDVEPGDPVHAGDADGRQEPTDRGRDQADEQRDEGDGLDGRARVEAERAAG